MDLEHSNGWSCPNCKEEGVNCHVKLFQTSPTHGVYFCESKNCLYPASLCGYLPVKKRTPDEMPVPIEILRSCSLPESLLEEQTLNMSYVPKLIQLQALIPHIKFALKVENEWNSFISNMEGVTGLISQHDISRSKDPDIEAFKQLLVCPNVRRFLKHFVPDQELDEILLDIR